MQKNKCLGRRFRASDHYLTFPFAFFQNVLHLSSRFLHKQNYHHDMFFQPSHNQARDFSKQTFPFPGQHWGVGQVSQSPPGFHGMPCLCGSPRSQSHSITSAGQVPFKWKPVHQESLKGGSEVKPMKQVWSSNAKSVIEENKTAHFSRMYCSDMWLLTLSVRWQQHSSCAILSTIVSATTPFPPSPATAAKWHSPASFLGPQHPLPFSLTITQTPRTLLFCF